MTTHAISLNLPEMLYQRLRQTAQATRQTLDSVTLHALQVGSPPAWDDAPAEFQADLAALDRAPDDTLWRVARASSAELDMARYQELLDRNAQGVLSPSEQQELAQLRIAADRFLLRRAHAAALLRWRGYQVPPPEAPEKIA